MELVVEGITNKERICGDPSEPKDVEKWRGVLIADGKVDSLYPEEFDLEESLQLEKHLFDCPRFDTLRMKHGIQPPGDVKQWFERRVPDFLREALQLFDNEWLRRAGATPSAISPLQKPANVFRIVQNLSFINVNL
ncbi:hypothetical protein XU18_2720 [Perkinsela sp. CCAP 1560/4]|nr:hypothetical protein XU18_2720 [Perkinsela sp. CCAP 1560/4]|eukprot:KNH06215.1 hypothetical protein XU18_2720 [Perkinsela sp. CCAP 1560/4]